MLYFNRLLRLIWVYHKQFCSRKTIKETKFDFSSQNLTIGIVPSGPFLFVALLTNNEKLDLNEKHKSIEEVLNQKNKQIEFMKKIIAEQIENNQYEMYV